jgi:threonine dehydratase
VLVLSGGNIDINLLDRVIGYGLAKAGRLMRLEIDLHDRPGELQKLLALIGGVGANVHTVEHDRLRRDVQIGNVRVMIELETRGPAHIVEVREKLRDGGYRIVTEEFPRARGE